MIWFHALHDLRHHTVPRCSLFSRANPSGCACPPAPERAFSSSSSACSSPVEQRADDDVFGAGWLVAPTWSYCASHMRLAALARSHGGAARWPKRPSCSSAASRLARSHSGGCSRPVHWRRRYARARLAAICRSGGRRAERHGGGQAGVACGRWATQGAAQGGGGRACGHAAGCGAGGASGSDAGVSRDRGGEAGLACGRCTP